jgi:hypothetical protein
MVQKQVKTQVRLRDFSSMSVKFSPVDHKDWHDVRNSLIVSATAPYKKLHKEEISSTPDAAEKAKLEMKHKLQLRTVEETMVHKPIGVSFTLDMSYNFLS